MTMSKGASRSINLALGAEPFLEHDTLPLQVRESKFIPRVVYSCPKSLVISPANFMSAAVSPGHNRSILDLPAVYIRSVFVFQYGYRDDQTHTAHVSSAIFSY